MSLFHYRRRWRVAPLLLGVVVTALLLSTARLSAQDYILFSGHLNGDCYPDTVWGKRIGASESLLPHVIVWGHPSQAIPSCPTAAPHPPGTHTVPATQFIYPNYPAFGGSCSFARINPNDSLDDMVFFLWGKNDSLAVQPDTGRGVVVFGQVALDTVPVVIFNLIQPEFQTAPFFAQELRRDRELTERAVRDLSGIPSYRLGEIPMPQGDPPQDPPKPVLADVRDSVAMRVYPNPSLYTTTIEAEVDAGVYTAQVVGVDGRVQREQEMRLEQRGLLWHNVDVATLPNGYYVVQLRRDGRVVGSYPFIIMR